MANTVSQPAKTARQKPCIYCGEMAPVKGKGEHIFPDALGGTKTLIKFKQVVCTKCNTGPLSEIDNELCSRSYLAIAAAQHFKSDVWQAWDVAPSLNNLLLEARPIWDHDGTLHSLSVHPQMIFDQGRTSVISDAQDVASLGISSLNHLLHRLMLSAYDRYNQVSNKGKKAIIFERIDRTSIPDQYRFVPRAFIKHRLTDVKDELAKQTVVLRYSDDAEKKHALAAMANLSLHPNLMGTGEFRGSERAPMAVNYNMNLTCRALAKIAFNFMAAYCRRIDLSQPPFAVLAEAIIQKGRAFHTNALNVMGFLSEAQAAFLNCPPNAHAFRLAHNGKEWWFFSAYFGGKLGSVVSFQAPNPEMWMTLNVVAPICSQDWTEEKRGMSIFPNVNPQWSDIGQLFPSLGLTSFHSGIRAELAKPKTRAPKS